LAALWLVAAAFLWRTTVPGGLDLPKLDPHRFFDAEQLAATARYERFVRFDALLSTIASIVALIVLVRRGPRIARNTGLGPIGAGVILAMVILAVLWAVQLPFAAALRWWDVRHDLARGSWYTWLTEPWAQLGGEVTLVMLQVVVVMLFARRFRRYWWIPVTPIFIALATIFVIATPYLLAGAIHKPSDAALQRDVQSLQRREGIDTPVDVEKVSDRTREANAFSVGLWKTERVVVWDTLLDGRFTNGQVRVVLAHEFGHIAHRHLWKGLGWTVLFAFPIAFALAEITRRRGGLGDPGVLPYGVLVLVLLSIPLAMMTNVVSRRYEAEADWSALRATNDPASMRALFQNFAGTSLQEPNPPTWAYIYFDTHPTLMQRIAMAQAWQDRSR